MIGLNARIDAKVTRDLVYQEVETYSIGSVAMNLISASPPLSAQWASCSSSSARIHPPVLRGSPRNRLHHGSVNGTP
jgi:hypothetical protein